MVRWVRVLTAQAWQPELKPHNSHEGRRKKAYTTESSSNLHVCVVACMVIHTSSSDLHVCVVACTVIHTLHVHT